MLLKVQGFRGVSFFPNLTPIQRLLLSGGGGDKNKTALNSLFLKLPLCTKVPVWEQSLTETPLFFMSEDMALNKRKNSQGTQSKNSVNLL